ncbi:MAG: DUF3108 domain-containing protein [Agarilytica sp.]
MSNILNNSQKLSEGNYLSPANRMYPAYMVRHVLLTIRSLALLAFFAISLVFMTYPQQSNAAGEQLLHQATYEGSYKGMDISMTRRLIHISGERYKLETKTNNFFGRIEEYEEFLWTAPNTIYPLYYHYKQKVLGVSKKRSISYDWKALTATSQYKKKKRTLQIEKGILGPMSYQLMFQIDLIHGKSDMPKALTYQFIRRGEFKQYVFNVLGKEKLRYKKQTISQAIAFTRENENKSKKTKIWFDPDNQYTLSALQQTKDNKVHNLFLTSSQYFIGEGALSAAKFLVPQK